MSKQKLEMRHITPYAAYGLTGMIRGDVDIVTELCFEHKLVSFLNHGTYVLKCFKPLLIPLSELTNEQWLSVFNSGNSMKDLGLIGAVSLHGRTHIKSDELGDETIMSFNPANNSFYSLYPFNQLVAFEKLFELHIDVFGLIESGLALNKLEVSA